MNRRTLLRLGAASLAASAMTKSVLAQNATPTATTSGGFPLDIYSKHIQWVRTPKDVAKAVADTALKSIDLTVQAYPGHVDPAKAETDLPAFVNGLKEGGIAVSAITTDIVDADSPNAEAVLKAASAAGIRYYGLAGFKYDPARPYAPQLEALKPRINRLARLSQRYNMTALYQPKRGPENVGSVLFDLLDIFKEFDPRHIAFRYDTAALLQVTQDTFVTHMRLAAPYIRAIAINDAAANLEFPVWDQGSFTGNPRQLLAPSGAGDNQGNAGGNWDAIGGGGRALPYRYRPKPVGTGMIDLTLIGKTLKDINFSGPAEAQIFWELDGVEKGTDKITYPRQEIIGHLKRDRLIIEQAFQIPWKIDVARPAFMTRQMEQQQGGAAANTPAPGRGGNAAGAN